MFPHIKEELTQDILPYWINNVKLDNGMLLGRITGQGVRCPEAEISGIMAARVLWTFSHAYRLLGDAEYLGMALRARHLIISRFHDYKRGGTYWSLNPDGTCRDPKKQIYAIAFTIYGLAEFYLANKDTEALGIAVDLFHDIEKHSFDHERNGYFEAFNGDWSELEDVRLSDKDANERKTMNTHLHILEAYTGLYKAWKNPLLEAQLRNLINLFLERIISADGHLRLFFSDDWICNYDIDSYGHDIECSWLLYEAAMVLGDKTLIAKVKAVVPKIADAAREGLGNGLAYERKDGVVDEDRHWWVQAEAVVGFYNAWQLTGRPEDLQASQDCWKYIRDHLIDRENGEWFWSVRADGTVNRDDDKAGFWKCPYHNGRMCMELIERNSAKNSEQL